jgi:hypothetical protein
MAFFLSMTVNLFLLHPHRDGEGIILFIYIYQKREIIVHIDERQRYTNLTRFLDGNGTSH